MSAGHSFKLGFNQLLRHLGGTVIIHRNRGGGPSETEEVRALKNSEKGKPNLVMFQFEDRQDIAPGDMIQQKGAKDLWRVVEVEDSVVGDTRVGALISAMNAVRGWDGKGSVLALSGVNWFRG